MINIIVATGHNGIIGLGNDLPWPRIPADMKMFAEMTKDSIVIMGRKTWDSIPAKFRPLPNRINVVVTRQDSFVADEGVVVVRKFDQETIDYVKSLHPGKDIFIIGGSEIYRTAIDQNLAEGAYVTRVGVWDGMENALASPDAVFFPKHKLDEKFSSVWAHVLTKVPCTCVVERYRSIDCTDDDTEAFDGISEFSNRGGACIRLHFDLMNTLLGSIPYSSRIRDYGQAFRASQTTGGEKWADVNEHPDPFVKMGIDPEVPGIFVDGIVRMGESDASARVRIPVQGWRIPETGGVRWTALIGDAQKEINLEYYLESQDTRPPATTKALRQFDMTRIEVCAHAAVLDYDQNCSTRIAIASVETFHDCILISYVPGVTFGISTHAFGNILERLSHLYPAIPVLGQAVGGLHGQVSGEAEPFMDVITRYTS